MAKRLAKKKTRASKPKAKAPDRAGQVVKLGRDSGKAPNILNPVSNYGYRQTFVPSEYNLTEISLIEDGEAYVRQAFQKKTSLMFKEGEVFTGQNESAIKYIKNRIRQIEYVTGIPWRSLLRQTGKELISKSNFFWVKVRKGRISGGERGVKRAIPIAGYFPMGAENVYVKKDRNGVILEYQQRLPYDRIRKFKPEDVIHFKCDVKPGFTFGTPKILPVITDIQALRRLEENVEILFYQTLFPIFQYKVGTENKPAGTITLQDGTVMDEVAYVRQQIQNMPTEGGIVTPERHEIEYIGANGQIPNYQHILQYFKSRVLAGLGISALDIGDGDTSNRATADSLSKALIDSVKEYQSVMEDIINTEVLTELLLEADFPFDALAEENFVSMQFREIDIEEQLKKNVNAQLLYNSDLIDVNEARQTIGLQPIEKRQESLMFSERNTLKIAESQHEMQMSLAEVQATKTGSSKNKKNRTQSAMSSAKNMSAPTNQHGTKTGPQKSRLDSLIEMESKTLKYFENKYGKDSDLYKSSKESAKQRIIKRLMITDSEEGYSHEKDYLNKYFDII